MHKYGRDVENRDFRVYPFLLVILNITVIFQFPNPKTENVAMPTLLEKLGGENYGLRLPTKKLASG